MLSVEEMLSTSYKRWPNQITPTVFAALYLLLTTAFVWGDTRHGIESRTGALIAGEQPEGTSSHARIQLRDSV